LGEHPSNAGQAYLGVTVGLVSIDGPPGHEVMPGFEFFDESPHLPLGEWDHDDMPFGPGEFDFDFEFEMPDIGGDGA